MEKNYRSAFSYALAYVKNDTILKKYAEYFNKAGIETTSKANLQNCILFAGALFDENVGYDEEKAGLYAKYRAEIQRDIMFTLDHVKVIKKALNDLTKEISRKDKDSVENVKHYEKTRKVADSIIEGIFEDELKNTDQTFIDELNR